MSRHGCAITALLTLALALPAGAQTPSDPDSKDAARTLALTGRARYEAGDYAGALQALNDAEKYFHAPTITRLQALTHEKLGHLLEAQRLQQQIADEKLASGAPAEFVTAQEEAKKSVIALEARIPKLQIAVLHAPAGTRVALDGRPLDAPALAAPIRLDPGKHTITIEPPGAARVTREIDLKEASAPKVEIDLAPPPPPKPTVPVTTTTTSAPRISPAPTALPAGTAVPSSNPDASLAPRDGRSFLGPGIAFGVGGAGLVIGAITGAMTLAKGNEVRDLCVDYPVCPKSQRGTVDDAKSVGYVATAAFVVAGIGAAAGVILLRLPAEKKSEPPRAALSIGPGSLTVKGAF